MRETNECSVEVCKLQHNPWKTSNVGDFHRDNPGWQWLLDRVGHSLVLCPSHKHQAAVLTGELCTLIGERGVNPMLLKVFKENYGGGDTVKEDKDG